MPRESERDAQRLVNTNDAKDFIGFLNTKPFGEAGIPALVNLPTSAGIVEAGSRAE